MMGNSAWYGMVMAAVLVGAVSVPAQEPPEWHTRYEPAVREAKEKGKNLFLLFTGSSWIRICETFKKDVLDQPEFYEPVGEKFVLLKLEFPKSNRLPEDRAAEYQLLRNAYRVDGYPTVVITDPEGRPFGLNGYQPVSAEQYAKTTLSMLKSREKRDAARKRAASAQGPERAEALVDAIPDLPRSLSGRYYREEMEEVIKLDSGDRTGKVAAYRRILADVDYANAMQKLAADVQYGKMIQLTDDYIREQELTGEPLQKALMNKWNVQRLQRDRVGGVETLFEVVRAGPETESGRRARQILEKLRAQKIQESLKD